MKERVMTYLPWLLLTAFIFYSYLLKDKNLKVALLELREAKRLLNAATYKLDSTLIQLDLIKDSLNLFIHNSDSLYSEFTLTMDSFQKEVHSNKLNNEKFNKKLYQRALLEKRNQKPTDIIKN